MSVSRAPDVPVDGSGLRVAVVSGSRHDEVMDGLRAGADRALAQAGGSRRYDALVALAW